MENNINEYMTVKEALDRWNLSRFTLRDTLSGRTATKQAKIEYALAKGLAKRYKGDSTRYDWILTVEIMEQWFGPEPVKK